MYCEHIAEFKGEICIVTDRNKWGVWTAQASVVNSLHIIKDRDGDWSSINVRLKCLFTSVDFSDVGNLIHATLVFHPTMLNEELEAFEGSVQLPSLVTVRAGNLFTSLPEDFFGDIECGGTTRIPKNRGSHIDV